jgi:nucleotide-binding universal stress UspA family protein
MEASGPAPCTAVVGYDGSPASKAALEHAARRAGPGGKVFVVHAYEPAPDFLGKPDWNEMTARNLTHGREVLATLPPVEGPECEIELLAQRPVDALVAVADTRRADLIAVGTRGFGPVTGAALGSVSHNLLARSKHPVLVVPPPT